MTEPNNLNSLIKIHGTVASDTSLGDRDYRVLLVCDDQTKEQVKAIGQISDPRTLEGAHVTLSGLWQDHPGHGHFFRFATCLAGEKVKIRGVVMREKRFEHRDGFRVMTIRTDREQVRIIGNFAEVYPFEGASITVKGRWQTDSEHGHFIKATSYVVEGGIEFFFRNVLKGLSPQLIDLILSRYKREGELEELLDNNPEKLLSFNGVGKKRLKKICESWEEYKDMAELAKFLGNYDIGPRIIAAVFELYGSQSVAVLKKNPYQLVSAGGSFRIADLLALKMGCQQRMPSRVRYGIVYVMKRQAEQGSTVVEPKDVWRRTMTLLSPQRDEERVGEPVDVPLIKEVVDDMLGKGELVAVGTGYSYAPYFAIEKKILDDLHRKDSLKKEPLFDDGIIEAFILDYERKIGFALDVEQRNCIRAVGRGERLIIVCGYAGTGKTTVARAMLELYEKWLRFQGESNTKESIICTALAGVAADKIKTLSCFDGGTIHSKLKMHSEEVPPEHNASNPWAYKAVLVDEGSMINAKLFSQVIDAVALDSLLILMGDDGQLRPIGEGNVFSDLLAYRRFCTIKLETIHRTSADGVLLEYANMARHGTYPVDFMTRQASDFSFNHYLIDGYHEISTMLPVEELDVLIETSDRRVRDSLIEYILELRAQGIDLNKDLQILTPARSGVLGVDELNMEIQPLINEYSGDDIAINRNQRFMPGDKVMHTENREMPMTIMNEKGEFEFKVKGNAREKIYNGTIGTIHSIEGANNQHNIYVEYSGHRIIKYRTHNLGDILRHAWAMTSHKAQGSEYRYVAIVLPLKNHNMLDNCWMYTALTRTRIHATVFGPEHLFRQACEKMSAIKIDTVIRRIANGYFPYTPPLGARAKEN